MNYMQYTNQPYMNNKSSYGANSGWNNRIRPVSSIDEVKAASIDFDGSVFYFPDLANKKIYTKQIGMDGAAILNMYGLQQIPVVTEQPVVDVSNFVTRQEFESVIKQIAAGVSQKSEQLVETTAETAAAETKPVFNF